jgi:hypothetical protein
MGAIVSASIDLAKIDKSKIYEKDGKKWLSIQVSLNDETDNYGNNASVTINQSKEERDNKAPKTYLGNGKVVWTDGSVKIAEKKENTVQNATNEVSDSPF